METFIFILILVFIVLFLQIKKNKLHVDFKSFFKPGFVKIDNAFGVTCYTGKQGTGKTYSAIKFIEEQKEIFGYIVISNVKSYIDNMNGVSLDTYLSAKNKKNITYIYEPDIMKIIDFCSSFRGNEKNILIFFDEIFTTLEKTGSFKKSVRKFLSQMRKRGIIFVTTAQEWAEINMSFRRYVRFQISCNMITIPFSNKAVLLNNINDGDQIHWDETQQDFVAPIIQMNVSKGLQEIINKYDTYETIDFDQSLNK